MTDGCSIHLVRDVAPNKRMFCISFRLPEAVAFRKKVHGLINGNPSTAPWKELPDVAVTEGSPCKKQRI
jgi:hypothetical protein